eukprot:superscaffoldBa00001073_g8825
MADGPRCKRRKQANPRRNNVALPGPWLAGVAEIKVSSIPCCKQRGVNSLQDDRCLQSVGYYSFLCRFSPCQLPSGIAAIPCNDSKAPLLTGVGAHSESLWGCLQTPPCPPIIITTSFFLFPPVHPSPPLLVVFSGPVNEKDWTDTKGRRRARMYSFLFALSLFLSFLCPAAALALILQNQQVL